MKIVFAGTPESAAVVLRGLVASGHEIVSVLTRTDSEVGRKRTLTSSPVAIAAEELGISCIKSNSVDHEVIQQLKSSGAELGIVVAYGTILKKAALDSLSAGWFNLHYSLLPKYRGAAPVQQAILNGESETGITIFKLDEGMDTGLIIDRMPVSIESNDTAGTLIGRMSELGVSLLNQTLPAIYNNQMNFKTQDGEPSFAPKPTRATALIDFNSDAAAVINQIRAMNPEPMAWANFGSTQIRILSAKSSPKTGILPGHLASVEDPTVGCGQDTAIELINLQPAGKNPMSARDWLRGVRDLEAFN